MNAIPSYLRLAALSAMMSDLDRPFHINPSRDNFKSSKRDIPHNPNQKYTAKSCAYQSKGSYCRKGEKYCKAKHAPCEYFELRKK